MAPYIAKVKYYIDDKEQHEVFLLYGETIVDIAKEVENICHPEDVRIICVGCDGDVFSVPDEIADAIMLGTGDYDTGLKIIMGENK